jgi:hypothetical protein
MPGLGPSSAVVGVLLSTNFVPINDEEVYRVYLDTPHTLTSIFPDTTCPPRDMAKGSHLLPSPITQCKAQ